MRFLLIFLLSLPLFSPTDQKKIDYQKIEISGYAQGTTWHITYYHQDSTVSKNQIDSILAVIDQSMSLYRPNSLINAFNQSAEGLTMDKHFRTVIEKSLDTYRRTDGLFDITVQPLVEAWGFSAKKVERFPDSAAVLAIGRCVGSKYLLLRGNRLIKVKPCVKIDLDGIAQGYSVDVLANFLEERGIRNYLVELGGEIRLLGRRQPGNQRMTVGIEAPGEGKEDGSQTGLLQKILFLDSGGITTSGNYHVFHESHGKKFSHTIDPRTGFPTQNELISVTVFAHDAITADAYDNVLMIQGLQEGMRFVESRKDLAAYFIYRKKDGTVGDTASSRFPNPN